MVVGWICAQSAPLASERCATNTSGKKERKLAAEWRHAQFLTKSIMTPLPKVKWSVVPFGVTGVSSRFACSLNARKLCSGSIHSAVGTDEAAAAGFSTGIIFSAIATVAAAASSGGGGGGGSLCTSGGVPYEAEAA